MGYWLMVIALMIVGMVVVGGLTRLTGSGLSITEWRPVTGAIPPIDETAWQQEFRKYQEIPQYRFENRGMTLSQFKSIYWWEWTHRFLGRLIGVAFLIPFLFFLCMGAISRNGLPRMLLLFGLGGLQGFVGWWMVESGLETRVTVSQYRLAIHLGLALILIAAFVWTALEYLREAGLITVRPRARAATFILLVYFQMLLGALVAGLHAGAVYNTWPSMDGRLAPEHPFFSAPWWINFFENPGLAQFDHRLGAYVVAISALALWWMAVRERHERLVLISGYAIVLVTILQLLLGIETLLHQAPVALSALHQTTALLLFSAGVWHAFELGREDSMEV